MVDGGGEYTKTFDDRLIFTRSCVASYRDARLRHRRLDTI